MAAEKRVKVTKAIQRKVEKTPAFKAGAGAKSGIATSLAFTPVQGIELVNPNARTTDAQDGTKSYFADSRRGRWWDCAVCAHSRVLVTRVPCL